VGGKATALGGGGAGSGLLSKLRAGGAAEALGDRGLVVEGVLPSNMAVPKRATALTDTVGQLQQQGGRAAAPDWSRWENA
jgi:hypothetical protein